MGFVNRQSSIVVLRVFLIFSLILTSFSVTTAPVFGNISASLSSEVTQNSFSDLEGHWAEDIMKEWSDAGLIRGYTDGTIRPDRIVSRGEAMALVNRSHSFQEQAEIQFSDLPVSNWAYGEAAKAVAAGYIQGYADGTIGIANPVSRQEAAAIVARLLKLDIQSDETLADTFKDADQIPQWSKGAIAAVAAAHIMKGYGDGSFKPHASITRAELVVVLDRAIRSKSTLVYNKAGTYGPAEGVQHIEGNATVNVSGVTLQNMTIAGDLILTEGIGEGDVFLRNVTVLGTTTVNGGGENSIHADNSVLATVIVDRESGTVRIVIEGQSSIAEVIAKSPVILEQPELTSTIGFQVVQIMNALPYGAKVVLIGRFGDVDVHAKSVIIEFPQGVIERLTVNEDATDVTLNTGKEANIVSLLLNAITKVLGQGIIDKATLGAKAKGTTFEKKPILLDGDGAQAPGSGSPGTGSGDGGDGGDGEHPVDDVIAIVENGQARAVVVAPSILNLADEKIPGWSPPYTSVEGKVKVVNTMSHSGDYSLHIGDNDSTKNYGAESELIAIAAGESYTASAMVYQESGAAPTLMLYYYNSNKELIAYPYSVSGTEGEWAEMTVAGTAPADAAYASVVFFSEISALKSFYVDDVVFKQTGGDELPIYNGGFEMISNSDVDMIVSYVRESTGVTLPVATEEMLDSDPDNYQGYARLYIGGSASDAGADVEAALDNVKIGGFAIQAKDDQISIVSPTVIGLEFGVYDFLERYVGVRWLMPGPDGVDVPARSTIVVPQGLIIDEPAVISRHFFGTESPTTNVEWARRNRMHHNIQFHHNLEHLFNPVVFSDYPEYYPGNKVPAPGTEDWNPCMNEDTARAAIDIIIQYFDDNPNASSYSLGVTDSRSHCESDPDHPLYPGDDHINSVGLLNMSDLYYPWVNRIAEGVLEVHPDKYFGLLAYAQVYDPPRNADGTPYKLNAHVIPYITDDRMSWLDPDIDELAQEHMQNWLESASSLGFYEYLYGSPYQIPRMYLHKMAANYKYAVDHNVVGHVAELYPNFGEGPKPWIAAKLQWNPNLDVDELEQQWYVAAVGEAAAPKLKAYYDHWDDFWTNRVFESDWYQTWKNTVPRKNYLNLYAHGYLKLITKEELEASRELLQEALALTQTDKQRIRAEALLKSFDYYEASAISYPRSDAVPTPENEEAALAIVAEFRESIEMANKRLQLYEEYKTDPIYIIMPNQTQHIESWDGVQHVLLTALENYTAAHEEENGVIRQELERIRQDFPSVFKLPAKAVKTTAGEELILRSLDFSEGPWVRAQPFSDFLITPSKLEPPVETKVRILWDDDNLYVGYENFDPDMTNMVYNDMVANNWWNGPTPDSVETFFGDPSTMYKGFFSNVNSVKFTYEMGVNPPTGLKGSPGTQWRANAKKYSDRWNTVQVIPFDSINIDPDDAGALMGFFLRNYHGMSVYISWGGGNTWTSGHFRAIDLVEDTLAEPIWVMAENGTVTVTLNTAETPEIGDFTVEQIINGEAPGQVSAILEDWHAASKKATLSVPLIAAGEADQSVVYRVQFRSEPAVEAAAFVVYGGMKIVGEGQPNAVVIVPQLTDSRIPGWRPPSTTEASKVNVVDSLKFSGSYSVHILDNDGSNYGLESGKTEVVAGQSYTASAQIFRESGDAPSIMLYFYAGNGSLIDYYPYAFGGEIGQWSELSVTGIAPANAEYAAVVIYSDYGGTRSIYVDDVAFKLTDGDSLSIENPGFELTFGEAASILADYVYKSSGAVLPVVTEATFLSNEAAYEGYIRIYVGGFVPTGDADLDEALATMPEDGYAIQMKENRIRIIGPSISGTALGVISFLETYIGVQWATGTEDEIVPSMATIVIPRTQ